MAKYYVDNNKTIYASVRTYQGSTLPGNSFRHSLTIDDLTDLSGQSTIFVNWLRFEFQGVVENGGLGFSYGHSIMGVVPKSAKTVAFEDYDDFMLYKGWPLKNSVRFYHAYSGNTANSANKIRIVYTFRPKKALLINREQAVIFQLWNEFGQPIQGLISCIFQLKRGS